MGYDDTYIYHSALYIYIYSEWILYGAIILKKIYTAEEVLLLMRHKELTY